MSRHPVGTLQVTTLDAASSASEAPGLQIEETRQTAFSAPSRATAVPVFIGCFRDLDGQLSSNEACIAIDSYVRFERRFGESMRVVVNADDTPTVTVDMALGALSVRHYFDNGGGPCFVLPLHNPADPEECAQLASKIARRPEINLYCTTEWANGSDPLYDALQPLLADTGGGFLIADSADGQTRPGTTGQRTAVYYPGVRPSYAARPDDLFIQVSGWAPDSTAEEAAVPPTLAEVRRLQPAYYAPLSKAVDQYFALHHPVLRLKASPAVAGVYCQTDRRAGPWAAPAGLALNAVDGLSDTPSARVTSGLAARRINAILAAPDGSLQVWGARTTVGVPGSPWTSIAVSRLFDSVARALKAAMSFAVFQSNDLPTWTAVRLALQGYLHQLWRAGALSGATASEAFYVQVGKGLSMTAEQIAEGQLIVKVGMAPVRPLEFIEVVFSEQLINA